MQSRHINVAWLIATQPKSDNFVVEYAAQANLGFTGNDQKSLDLTEVVVIATRDTRMGVRQKNLPP